MRLVLTAVFLSMLSITALGQTIRIAPDEAAKHLVRDIAPDYPPLAQATRIQGNVLLQVRVDESGAAAVTRLITGHPMLVQAAINAVNRRKYQPFIVDGKPAAITTLVLVRVGKGTPEGDVQAQAEMAFQHNFWTAAESARAALAAKDLTRAEEQLSKASDLLALDKKETFHVQERWQLATTMGDLRALQQKYDEAEQQYKTALALTEKEKDAPETAASLWKLANVYETEKKHDLAREHAARSVAIYKKNLKSAGSTTPAARVYGRAIALQSWMLSNLAVDRKDSADAIQQCRTVVEFQMYLDDAVRDSVVPGCRKMTAGN